MKAFSLWIPVAVVLAISPYVWAADEAAGTAQPVKQKHALKAADTNGDGKLTFEEIKAARPKITQEVFNKIDTNKDGFLSPEELRAAKSAKEGAKGEKKSQKDRPGPEGQQGRAALAEKLKQADKNGDNKVTFEELQGVMPKVSLEQFARFDRNKDGVISKEDHAEGKEGANPERPAARLKEADVNGDGKISLEEARKAFPKMTEEQFKKRDTNGDGFLSKEDHKKIQK